MGKIVLLAMMTIDGCISNSEGIKEWGLNRDTYEITKLYADADMIITEDMTMKQVAALREKCKNFCFFEIRPGKEDFFKNLLDSQIIDELFIYLFSYTVGSGIPLFPHDIRISTIWKLEASHVYNEEIIRLHYVKRENISR